MASKSASQGANGFRTMRFILIGLAVVGVLVAGYLTFTSLSGSNLLCRPGGGCETVQNSIYSKVGGIPVAVIGLLGYLGILSVLLLENSSNFLEDNGPIFVFGMSLIGFLYSAYLIYVSKFMIGALCPWCVTSAVLMTLIFGLSIYRAVQTIQQN
jgi:uncharacterized membrane protein